MLCEKGFNSLPCKTDLDWSKFIEFANENTNVLPAFFFPLFSQSFLSYLSQGHKNLGLTGKGLKYLYDHIIKIHIVIFVQQSAVCTSQPQ